MQKLKRKVYTISGYIVLKSKCEAELFDFDRVKTSSKELSELMLLHSNFYLDTDKKDLCFLMQVDKSSKNSCSFRISFGKYTKTKKFLGNPIYFEISRDNKLTCLVSGNKDYLAVHVSTNEHIKQCIVQLTSSLPHKDSYSIIINYSRQCGVKVYCFVPQMSMPIRNISHDYTFTVTIVLMLLGFVLWTHFF